MRLPANTRNNAGGGSTVLRVLTRVLCAVLPIQVVVALSLCGCDSKHRDSQGSHVVRIWAHHGREQENAALRHIVDAFNQTHAADRLRAEITFYPDRQYADKVSVAALSDALPDVLDVDGPYVGPWAAEGLLTPMDELVDEDLRGDVLPTLIQQGTYQGRLYALGAFDSALVVYYNREIITKAGLEPPERVADAWTWDEFVRALEVVKPHARIALSLHMDEQSDEWFTYAFAPLIWSSGGRLIDTADQQVLGVLNSAAAVRALQRWQALFRDGLAAATTTDPDPFSDGSAAFDWTGHWMLPTFEQTAGLRFGVMPLPKMGDRVVTGAGSWCWGISRDCPDKQTAWKVVAWFLDPEKGIKPIVQANGAVPGRRSAFVLFPEYQSLPRRLLREQLEVAGRARPRTPVYLALTSEFARALRDIASGSDVARRLTQAAENVQRVVDRR